jgi:hypothetical protein
VLSVNQPLPDELAESCWIEDETSLLDYDVILFFPSLGEYQLDIPSHYSGAKRLSDHSSKDVRRRIEHWKSEIATAIAEGRHVVMFIDKPEYVYIATGERRQSGTGRNARTTNIVTQVSALDMIPYLDDVKIHGGNRIAPSPSCGPFGDFWKEFSKHFKYEVSFQGDQLSPLLNVLKSDRVVGGFTQFQNGYLVILPKLIFPHALSPDGEVEEDWQPSEVKFATRFVHGIIRYLNAISNADFQAATPDWLDDVYSTPAELELMNRLALLDEQAARVQAEIFAADALLQKEQALKQLLFGSGTALEDAVIEALRILGVEASKFNDGNSEFDVCFEFDGKRYVGECEGRENKAIDVTKHSQLERNLNEYFALDGVIEHPIGILFGNGYASMAPAERPTGFTAKCLASATRAGTILVNTSDLYIELLGLLRGGQPDASRNILQKLLGANGQIAFRQADPTK